MSFSIILAHEKSRGIGYKGQIPWHIKKDFQWFKDNTMGHPVIMGLTTYFSFLDKFRPLPGRENLVLSDIPEKNKIIESEGAKVFSSIDNVVEYCKNKDCFVIGGASIYKQFFQYSDKLYLTEIDSNFKCDTFFIDFDYSEWNNSFKSELIYDENLKLNYTFNIYERKNKIIL